MSRAIFRAALAAAGLALSAGAAAAQDFPTRPITFIVPWAAGSGSDLVLRAMSDAASKDLGQPIIIENKAGGGGTVGPATMAATSKADGYTIGQIPISVFRYQLMQGTAYDSVKDFTYIANLSGYVITTQAGTSTGFKTWKDVVDYAKANPGKVTYATSGAGTSGHIAMELMAAKSGVKFSHVPFKSNAEANLAAVGGHTMLSVSGLESKPMVEAGKLVFLNIWTAKRNAKIPDAPTLLEIGYPYVFESPYGIAGPKGMDPKIVLKIQNAYKKALDDPAVIALMDRYEMLRGSFMDSVAYTKFVADYMVSEKENLTQLGLMKKD
jgi:tripartite-type tricarboxylate transporter receptor subunit TctC